MRIPLAQAGLREMALISLVCVAPAGAGFAAAATGAVWGWPVALFFTVVWAGGVAFFRDPHRTIPDAPGVLVAPADGKVTDTAELQHQEDIGGPARRIGIFLSIFDVHVNRSPCAGVVRKIRYQRGRFFDARDERAGECNESNTIVIEPDDPDESPIVVRQIAGLIARRIVCDVKVGDRVEPGQRIGLIKFGSRTELLVGAGSGYTPAVDIGDRARGAATVLARRESP